MVDGRGQKLVDGGPVPVEVERIAANPLQGVHALDRPETIALVIQAGVISKVHDPLRGEIPLSRKPVPGSPDAP